MTYLIILMQLQNIHKLFKSIEQSLCGGGGFTEEQIRNYYNFKLLLCKNRFTKYTQLGILL